MLVAKLLSKEGVKERDVVVNAPRFEDLFSSEPDVVIPLALFDPVFTIVVLFAEFASIPSVFNVFPELKAKLVRIDLTGMHGHGARMMIGEVDDFGVIERALGHDFRVP